MTILRNSPQKILDNFKVFSGSTLTYSLEFQFDGPVSQLQIQGDAVQNSGSNTPQIAYTLQESLDGVHWTTLGSSGTSLTTLTTFTTLGLGRFKVQWSDTNLQPASTISMSVLATE